MSVIIGREKEIAELKELYDSDKSEFVAVYGRFLHALRFPLTNK